MKVIPIRARTHDEFLDRIAHRLVQLLQQEPDPDEAMGDALAFLEARELWNGSMHPEHVDRGTRKCVGFAQNVIVRNLLVREAVTSSDREFEPVYCETVEELLSELLPLRS